MQVSMQGSFDLCISSARQHWRTTEELPAYLRREAYTECTLATGMYPHVRVFERVRTRAFVCVGQWFYEPFTGTEFHSSIHALIEPLVVGKMNCAFSSNSKHRYTVKALLSPRGLIYFLES